MKNFKKSMVLLALMLVFFGCSTKSFAANPAVVDLEKIMENYTVAQELTAELKVKEAELEKFVVEARKQIEAAKTPVEKKNLEEKLGQQFNIKTNAYTKDQVQKWSALKDTVIKTIKEVSAAKKYDLVLNKQVVIDGGADITNEVLVKLNTQAKNKDKK